jgi:hypothetical protein
MVRYRYSVHVLRVFVAGVVVLIGFATLVGLLDRFWWVFEAADVFRLQYLVMLVGAALAAFLLRRSRLATLAAAPAVVKRRRPGHSGDRHRHRRSGQGDVG